VIRTDAAIRSGPATRQDLLLETLALRHQLAVLARSNKRFRPADRLFWLFLRWLWPRWREALVLIQPATVDRWQREGVRRRWRHRSRRPGRPPIDSNCRDLIRRMAAENCLWGAPRIHGELLKLGFTISERTVSRYLRGRPTTRSQTWRTFFANHFAGQTFLSLVMFADANDEDIVANAADVSLHSAPSIDASCACIHRPTIDGRRSRQLSSLGASLGQHHLQGRTGASKSSGRDPPRHLPLQPGPAASAPASFMRGDSVFATDGSVRSVACACSGICSSESRLEEQSSRQRRRRTEHVVHSPSVGGVTCTGWNIGEPQRAPHRARSIGYQRFPALCRTRSVCRRRSHRRTAWQRSC
jgi:hypothetical protein